MKTKVSALIYAFFECIPDRSALTIIKQSDACAQALDEAGYLAESIPNTDPEPDYEDCVECGCKHVNAGRLCTGCFKEVPYYFNCFTCGEECNRIDFGSWINSKASKRIGIVCKDCIITENTEE